MQNYMYYKKSKKLQQESKKLHTCPKAGLSDQPSDNRSTETRADRRQHSGNERYSGDYSGDKYGEPTGNRSFSRDASQATENNFKTSSVCQDKSRPFAAQLSDINTMMKELSISDSGPLGSTFIVPAYCTVPVGESQCVSTEPAEVSTSNETLGVPSFHPPVEESNEFPSHTELVTWPTTVVKTDAGTKMDFGFSCEWQSYSRPVKDWNASSTKAGLPPPTRDDFSSSLACFVPSFSPPKKPPCILQLEEGQCLHLINMEEAAQRMMTHFGCHIQVVMMTHKKAAAQLMKTQFGCLIKVVMMTHEKEAFLIEAVRDTSTAGFREPQGQVTLFLAETQGKIGHWVCLQFVYNKDHTMDIKIYDSCWSEAKQTTWHTNLQETVKLLFCSSFSIFMSSPQQVGNTHCGLYAIANAVLICKRSTPPDSYIQEDMLQHLKMSIKTGSFELFPAKSESGKFLDNYIAPDD